MPSRVWAAKWAGSVFRWHPSLSLSPSLSLFSLSVIEFLRRVWPGWGWDWSETKIFLIQLKISSLITGRIDIILITVQARPGQARHQSYLTCNQTVRLATLHSLLATNADGLWWDGRSGTCCRVKQLFNKETLVVPTGEAMTLTELNWMRF